MMRHRYPESRNERQPLGGGRKEMQLPKAKTAEYDLADELGMARDGEYNHPCGAKAQFGSVFSYPTSTYSVRHNCLCLLRSIR
jgi:hypothetical protein